MLAGLRVTLSTCFKLLWQLTEDISDSRLSRLWPAGMSNALQYVEP